MSEIKLDYSIVKVGLNQLIARICYPERRKNCSWPKGMRPAQFLGPGRTDNFNANELNLPYLHNVHRLNKTVPPNAFNLNWGPWWKQKPFWDDILSNTMTSMPAVTIMKTNNRWLVAVTAMATSTTTTISLQLLRLQRPRQKQRNISDNKNDNSTEKDKIKNSKDGHNRDKI